MLPVVSPTAPRIAGSETPADAEARQLSSACRELDRSQWLDSSALEELQLLQLRQLLDHCRAHVPYYEEVLAAARVRIENMHSLADLRRVPLLPRRTFQERAPDFRARALPSGTHGLGSSTTSGTSGVPVEVRQTNVGQTWWWALYLRDLAWSGIDPRGVLAVIRPAPGAMHIDQRRRFQHGMTSPCWHPRLQAVLETGTVHAMDIHQDPPRQMRWLGEVNPDYLLSYPSHLDFLASLFREAGQKLPSLRVIQTVSETLTPEVQDRIEKTFGVPVKPIYSCGEAGYLASPCPLGHGMHVHAEHVILEVLDENDQPCGPGQTGRVVLTNLHNILTPLVRYEILDEATVLASPCPCGRGLPLLGRLQGKRRPLLHLPGGGRKHSDGLACDLRYLGGLHQYQIVQKAADHVHIRVVPAGDWTSEHPNRIRRLVEDFFESPMRVDIDTEERLAPGRGGKLVDVVCDVAEVCPFFGANDAERRTTLWCDAPRRDAILAPKQDQSDSYGRAIPLVARTVLLAWELGDGLADVRQLRRVAQALAEHGHRPIFATRDGKNIPPDLPFEVILAPARPLRSAGKAPRFLASTFADILAVNGFAEPVDLLPLVKDWQRILDQVEPDMILCIHAPALCLAAYQTLPVAMLGFPFSIPPTAGESFPTLIERRAPVVAAAHVLAAIQQVQRQRGRPAPARLVDLFADCDRFLTCLPELDPYRAFRKEPHLGPLDPLPKPAPAPSQPGYIACLDAAHAGSENIVAGLSRTWHAGFVYLRGATEEQRRRLQRPGLVFLDGPPDLNRLLDKASIVVHHGDVNLAQAVLAAGRPQLLFPAYLEQLLNAQMLHAAGVGHYLTGRFPEDDVTQALSQIIEDRTLMARAQDAALAVEARGPWDPVPAILKHCSASIPVSSQLR